MVDRVMVLENTRANQIKLATKELLELTEHSAAAQREVISSVEAMLRAAAYIHVTSEQSDHGCSMLRRSLHVEMPWITNLSVVGKNGRISCSTAQNYVGLDVTDRPYYQKTLYSKELVISDLVVSRLSQKPLLIASYSTSSLESEDPSIIVAGLNMDWIAKLMSGLGNRPAIQAALLDSNGTILANQPIDHTLLGQTYQGFDSETMGLEQAAGTTSLVSNGIQKLISFVRIPGTDNRLIVSIDHDKLFAPISSAIRKAYIQLTIVSVLVLLGAWFVGEQFIIRPIRMMTSMAKRFGQGDLTARVTARKLPAEFNPLAIAFNMMASQLSERERELVATNDHLTVMASIDIVSGLANRRGLQNRLEFEWLKVQQLGSDLALMMIDVDYFKLFNDSYGHPEGDVCLNRIGDALAGVANDTMGFAARYGGEEFCLLLPGADRNRAVEIGEMVRQTIEHLKIPHVMSKHGHVTVSVGVARIAPNAMQHPNELLEAADAALYAAKHRGRNTVAEHGLTETPIAPMSMAG
jgi:diguanylate cyclase (GGDEF)-like protein